MITWSQIADGRTWGRELSLYATNLFDEYAFQRATRRARRLSVDRETLHDRRGVQRGVLGRAGLSG